jgi:hypothetical protein
LQEVTKEKSSHIATLPHPRQGAALDPGNVRSAEID